MSESILKDLSRGVLVLRLNRPDKFNSFNREMALRLISALEEARDQDEVRSVLLTGVGKAFCAGQDLAEAVSPDGIGIKRIVEEHYNRIIRLIRNIEKPVVCAVNGVAAGAGANIALACDLTLASSSAAFIQAFVKIGLIPDSGGTYFLPRLAGLQRASALAMLGEKLSAEDAFRFGLIFKVVPDEKLASEAEHIASTLAALPTKAIGLTKRLFNQSFENTFEQQLDNERDIQAMAAATDDYREGVNSFLEKRKPVFTGK